MARQTGLGRALEIILGARDFDADEAEYYDTVNKALDADKIGPYVDELANRIAKFPAESIESCKRAVYASIDLPIDEALKEEAYWLYQATSKTPAIKRFAAADDGGFWCEPLHALSQPVVLQTLAIPRPCVRECSVGTGRCWNGHHPNLNMLRCFVYKLLPFRGQTIHK